MLEFEGKKGLQERGREVIELADDGASDEDFISMVDAVEAKALLTSKSKRQMVSDPTEARQEGSYMAALRGSRSLLWQQQQEMNLPHKKDKSSFRNDTLPPLASAGSGACFKCGMDGHWARDCTAGRGTDGGSYVNSGGSEVDVADKACPCGLGNCLVLTSNTAKNPGRKFYRCPFREEHGGCSFFEWCDNQSSGFSTSGGVPNSRSNSSVPDLPCPCGAGSCLILVTKSGKNVGQQYYRCPGNEGSSCGFFRWCNEQTSVTSQTPFTSKFRGLQSNSSNQVSGERSGSSCFKCGQEGHWARNCPSRSSDFHTPDNGGRRLAPLGPSACFKCNKAGHWARDCPGQDPSSGAAARSTSDNFQSPYGYKLK